MFDWVLRFGVLAPSKYSITNRRSLNQVKHRGIYIWKFVVIRSAVIRNSTYLEK